MSAPRRPRPGWFEKATITAAKESAWIERTDTPAVMNLRELQAWLDQAHRVPSLPGMPVVPGVELVEVVGLSLRIMRELGWTPRARQQLGLIEVHDTLAAVIDHAEAAARHAAKSANDQG